MLIVAHRLALFAGNSCTPRATFPIQRQKNLSYCPTKVVGRRKNAERGYQKSAMEIAPEKNNRPARRSGRRHRQCRLLPGALRNFVPGDVARFENSAGSFSLGTRDSRKVDGKGKEKVKTQEAGFLPPGLSARPYFSRCELALQWKRSWRLRQMSRKRLLPRRPAKSFSLDHVDRWFRNAPRGAFRPC